MGMAFGVALEPCKGLQLLWIVAVVILGRASRATGVFPLGFGRQPVSCGGKIALPGLRVIARLQALLQRSGIAESRRSGPTDLLHRVLGILAPRGVLAGDRFVDFLRDLMLIHEKLVDFDRVLRLRVDRPIVRPHGELACGNVNHVAAALGFHNGTGCGLRRLRRGAASGQDQHGQYPTTEGGRWTIRPLEAHCWLLRRSEGRKSPVFISDREIGSGARFVDKRYSLHGEK